MNVEIREFTLEDESSLKDCIRELKEYESQFDEEYLVSEQSVIALYDELVQTVEAGRGGIKVAVVDGRVVGFISYEIGNKNDELIVGKVPCVYISDLVVLPEYRRKGIAGNLCEEADSYAKANNISYVKLIVFSGNEAAVKLYETMGFGDYEQTLLKRSE